VKCAYVHKPVEAVLCIIYLKDKGITGTL